MVCINGWIVTFWVVVVSQGISQPNAESCTGFPPPLGSRRLRSRIAKVWCLSPVSSCINICLVLKYPFSYTGFLKTKWRQPQTFECHYVTTMSKTSETFSWLKASVKWSVKAATLSHVKSCKQFGRSLGFVKLETMFKQYVNLMIWTWTFVHLTTASCNKFYARIPLWHTHRSTWANNSDCLIFCSRTYALCIWKNPLVETNTICFIWFFWVPTTNGPWCKKICPRGLNPKVLTSLFSYRD